MRTNRPSHRKLPNRRKRPHLLDLIDHFYLNRVPPLVPDKLFSIQENDMLALARKLGTPLDLMSKQVVEDACATFVNAVVFEAYGATRRSLASYAGALSKASAGLINLLIQPEKVRAEYEPVHEILFSNWVIAGLSLSREEILSLARKLQLLSADVLRVSKDHKPVKSHRGGQPDIAFVEFTQTLRYIRRVRWR
jgi:hypothetical protein